MSDLEYTLLGGSRALEVRGLNIVGWSDATQCPNEKLSLMIIREREDAILKQFRNSPVADEIRRIRYQRSLHA